MSGTSGSSLSLRFLLKDAASTTGLAASATRLSGLTAAAKAFTVAAASLNGPAVLVVPADKDIEPFVSDARFFLGSLEGLSGTALERGVLSLPSPEVDPYRGLLPHFDVASARARALHGLATGQARIVVASAAALLPRLPAPEDLIASSLELKPGDDIDPMDLADILVRAGFTREDPVDQHGEFSIRGNVADIFPAGDRLPVRLEFVGDTIESIRQFDPATQRSVTSLDRITVAPVRETADTLEGRESERPATFFSYLGRASRLRLFVSEFDKVREAGDRRFTALLDSYQDALAREERVLPPARLMLPWPDVMSMLPSATSLETFAADADMVDGAGDQPDAIRATVTDRYVSCQPVPTFHGRVPEWVHELRAARQMGETAVLVAETAGRAERVTEILREYGVVAVDISRAEVTSGSALLVTTGSLTQGFRLPAARMRLYAETDIFDEERVGHQRRASAAKAFLSDFRDLKVGDHVVHVDNGIGVFVGLKQINVGHETREFMELRYHGDDKLFVPVDRLDLVQKFSGSGRPTLDRLGGATWEKAKARVKKAMRDMADELLKLYAARKAVQGHAFPADTHWQEEFEGAFPYELTPDQANAVIDIKRDMESTMPMDRLLCGDVGYGKTEVAMRGAFKAVMDGKQVAFLAPTTVLALQHLKTLRTRFAAFPVRIDMVSRFRTKAEQAETLKHLREGKLDIIVGTHRLLAKDVEFRDLGLLVVDEEQRFGVTHKERIKQMRKRVDVLTMSATPIPRTLNMSLVGIRDMSVIETAPHDRQAVQTAVLPFDPKIIGTAIAKELERGGQVYFVHNRVESIHSMAGLLARVAPEGTRIGIGHGQMGDEALEKVMVEFIERRYDILLSTTIIENGLDIPNANTMIINRADRYGLGQLYQLRGRVGRSDRRAYAYLLIPPVDSLSEVARKRLAAIKEFSALGSGFRIAALDLEIRGAGNLLGGEQSGHIEAIGFEMYTKLLEETIRELKGEDLEDDRRATVNLGVEFRIDEDYIPDTNQRLGIYRQVAQARTDAEVARVVDDLRDRYGPVPESVLSLADHARLRVMADHLKLDAIEREGKTIVFKFRESATVDPQRLLSVVNRRVDLRLVPPGSLKLDLDPQPIAPKLTPAPGRPGAARPGGLPPRGGPATHRPVAQGGSRGPSWWTVRATAGEVAPGFTKAEVLKPMPEDPRAPDGLFARVAGVMKELSDDL
jgi:transcription-repair coupling factor (superfamily II helicase)